MVTIKEMIRQANADGYVAIAVSIFLNYIFARFFYRKPTSKWSVYGVRKR